MLFSGVEETASYIRAIAAGSLRVKMVLISPTCAAGTCSGPKALKNSCGILLEKSPFSVTILTELEVNTLQNSSTP